MTQTEIELPGTAGMVAGLLGNEVQSLYGPFAARLYHLMTQFDTVAMEELQQATKDVPGPVLELGAGTGRLTFPFLERGYEVVASDLSPDMLAILDQRLAEPEAASFAANCTTDCWKQSLRMPWLFSTRVRMVSACRATEMSRSSVLMTFLSSRGMQ